MQQASSRFQAQGLSLTAISYDNAETLRSFSKRMSIGYPLLSDPGSTLIRRFHMLDPDNSERNIPAYGTRDVAYPGWFFIDPSGVVKEKFLDPFWGDRYTANNVIGKMFPELSEAAAVPPQSTPHLNVRATQSDTVASPGSRITLGVEIRMADGMHIYAPGVQGYRPVQLILDSSNAFETRPAVFPPSEILELKAIDEKAPVYRGKVRIAQDIVVSYRGALQSKLPRNRDEAIPVEVTGKLLYQACDDKVCYRLTEVPLHWTISVHRNDNLRPPPEDRQAARQP